MIQKLAEFAVKNMTLTLLACATTTLALSGILYYFATDFWSNPGQWYPIACGAALIGPFVAFVFYWTSNRSVND
jgi:hypothetical protein